MSNVTRFRENFIKKKPPDKTSGIFIGSYVLKNKKKNRTRV